MAESHKRRWLTLAGLGSPLLLLVGGGLTVTGGWLIFRAAAPDAAKNLVERVTGTTPRQVVSKETRLAWDSDAPIRMIDEAPVAQAIQSGETFIADPAYSSGVSDDPPPSEEVQRELAESLAGFLAVRALEDAAAYRSYMNARGYYLRDDDEWADTLDWYYNHHVGEGERPSDWGAWEAFQATFEEHAAESNDDWLVAVSSVPEVVKMRFATLIDGRGPPDFDWTEIPLDSHYWSGPAISMQRFFVPGVSRLDILRRDGKVLTGRVRLPVQARGGEWSVLSMTLYFEPRSARWFIEHMGLMAASNMDRAPVY